MYLNVLNVCATDGSGRWLIDRDQYITVVRTTDGTDDHPIQPIYVSGLRGDELFVYAEAPDKTNTFVRMGYLVTTRLNGASCLVPHPYFESPMRDVYVNPAVKARLLALDPTQVAAVGLTDFVKGLQPKPINYLDYAVDLIKRGFTSQSR